MERPGTLLTLFAAVLCSAAPTALSKLPCEFLPFPALVVGTLSNATTGIVLAAQVTHNNSGPVLHIRAVVSNSELLYERENVEIIRKKVLLFELLILGILGRNDVTIEQL